MLPAPLVPSSPRSSAQRLGAPARWNWKRTFAGLGAVFVILGASYWWLFVRLNALERQLIGTWEGTHVQETGVTVKLYCELRADRTAVVEFSGIPRRSTPLRLKQPSWRESNGYLLVQEPLSLQTRVQLLWYRIWGSFGGVLQVREGLGQIRDVRSNVFEMGNWRMQRVRSRAAQK